MRCLKFGDFWGVGQLIRRQTTEPKNKYVHHCLSEEKMALFVVYRILTELIT